jgi:hypothetical protein
MIHIVIYQLVYITLVFWLGTKFISIAITPGTPEEINSFRYYKIDEEVGLLLLWLYPVAFIQSVNEILKTYSYSQGIEVEFGYFYLFSTFVSCPVCWYCVVNLEQGILGFAAYKYVNEILNLIFCLYIFYYRLNPNTTHDLFKDYSLEVNQGPLRETLVAQEDIKSN